MRLHALTDLGLEKLTAWLAVIALGVCLMPQAKAGCGQYGGAQAAATGYLTSPAGYSGRFMRVASVTESSDAAGADTGASLDPDWQHNAPITGLWYFKYISEGNTHLGIPDGAIVDGGNTTWFADGNEMTSSAMRAPDTGSICLGVWKRTGDCDYELNHIGLSWDPVKNVFVGPAFIKQYVKLEKGGDKYTGTFTITQLAADGKTVDVVIKGKITATRVTVHTDTQT